MSDIEERREDARREAIDDRDIALGWTPPWQSSELDNWRCSACHEENPDSHDTCDGCGKQRYSVVTHEKRRWDAADVLGDYLEAKGEYL